MANVRPKDIPTTATTAASDDYMILDGSTNGTRKILSTANFASPSPIGSGTPSTGAFTNLSASGTFALTGDTVQLTEGGTGASDAGTARTNLGLGSIATQAANNVSISGGSITGITDLAVADGGTGASDAPTARTNLGLGTVATKAAPSGTSAQLLANDGSGGFSNVTVGSGLSYAGGTLSASGGGTVTSVSVASANGFAGTVADASTTPAITLSTSVTGLLKGNGTAVSAATSGTDYAPATSGTAILKGNGAGGFSSASAGTDYEVPLTFSTGLTRSTNTVTVNTTQSISTLSNLTSNGFVKTSGGTGALSIDTNTYLTTAVTSLAGTANEITASASTGSVTLSIPSAVTFTGKTITGGTFNSGAFNGTVGATTANTGAFTTLSASSTVSGTGFTNYFASPPAIGSTAANTGAFTTLSATGNVTFDTNTLFVDSVNDRVGVGTTTPAYKLQVSGSGAAIAATDSAVTTRFIASSAASGGFIETTTNHPLIFRTNETERMRLDSSGNLGIGTTSPASKLDVSGTIRDSIGDVRLIPQNSQSAAYTLALTDSGKHILHPSADTTARTFTIPANSSVAFSIGTAVTFVNQNGAGTVTIAITTDTMRLAGTGSTGSRTLAANGVATAIKITSTEWIISGTGLT